MYGAVAIVLVVAVVAVAYGSVAPQLGVAEFAPAGRQIEAPPSTDVPASNGGLGSGSGRGRSTTTTAAPVVTAADGSVVQSAPTTKVGRARTCVGSPPRQIEDPQSPPCVPFVFEGDNGGATSAGVSATEIRVAIDNAYDDKDGALQALFDYFNIRFEFYGRRLVPVLMPYNVQEPPQQRAMAEEIAANNVFAASGRYPNHTLPTLMLHQALARAGVISLNGQEYPYGEESLLAPFHPYVWAVNSSAEELWATTGELICKALKGRPASHAGAALANTTRKFGVISAMNVLPTMPLSIQSRQLIDRLNDCEAPLVSETIDGNGATGSAGYRLALEKLKASGVTTVLCACISGVALVIDNAIAVGYEPEIMLPNIGSIMESLESALQTPARAPYARHVFGVHHTPKLLPYQVRPVFSAIRSILPAYDLQVGGQQFRRMEKLYKELLLLASGIQGAGPSLTPDSFGQALMTMEFPNPGAGQAPYWQGAVGFGPGDHTMADDAALAWWNPTLVSTSVTAGSTASGSWCFLGAGSRFRAGELPADADTRFFNPAEPCR